MPFEIIPVGADDVFEPAAPAAPPEVGPKNIYRKGQPQVSTTDTVTIPSAEKFVLPKVIDENAPKTEAAKPEYKIEPVTAADQLVPPSEVYDPSSDFAPTRGFKTAFTGTGSAIQAALAMPRQATLGKDELTKELLAEGAAPADPRNASLQVGDFSKIRSLGTMEGLGDLATYVGESLGSVAGSWLGAALYGGGAGAVTGGGIGAGVGALGAGAGALPGAAAGAATGFTYGTMLAFVTEGIGGQKQEMLRDKAIREGLANGTLDPHEVLALATGSGAAIGALDAVPAGKFFAQIGGKPVAKEAVKQLLKKAALQGALKEGGLEAGTEGLQETIGQVTTALTGGDYDAANRALDVLNATIVGGIGGAGPGAVGGVTENARIPPVPHPEIQPGGKTADEEERDKQAATPAAEPGVAGTVDPTGQPAGGNTTATQPQPPANAPGEATAAATPAATTIDPSVAAAAAAAQPEQKPGAAGAGPAATPTDQPVIEEEEAYPEDTGPVLPETPEEAGVLERQQEELARISREQYAAHAAEQAARAQEKAAQAPVVSTSAEDIAAAVTARQDKRRQQKVTPVSPVDIGENVAPTAPTPVTPLAGAPTPETPTVPTAETPLAAETAPPLDKSVAAPGTVGIPAQISEAAGPVAPAPTPPMPLTPAPAEPIPTTPAPAEPVAAFAAPAAAEIVPVTADDQLTPVAPRAELIKAVSKAKEAPAAPAAAPAAPAAAAAAKPLTMAEKVKARMAGRKVVEIPKKAAGAQEAPKAPEAQLAAPTQPAAAPAAQAAKKTAAVRQASSDVAARVRQHPELTKSRISELDDSLVGGTVEDVVREVATTEVEKGGRSLRETIDAVAARHGEILAEVKKRLQPKLEEHEAELERVSRDKSFEAKQTAAKREAEAKEAAAKVEKQAAATKGTEKERAGKGKGLSPTGIRARSADTWIKQAREQAGKPGADERVTRIRELVLEERRKGTPEARKAEALAERKALVEQLASERQAELDKEAKAAEAAPGINKEHRETERQLKNATAHLPLPALEGSENQQAATLRKHLADFLKAIERIKVAGVHSMEHNSPIENLAVFAHKLRQNERDVEGMGPFEFWQAQMYAESGAVEELRGLTTNEKIKGSELREEVTEGEGEEKGGKLAALHEDETSGKSRVRAETVAKGEIGLGDLALRKGGREGAVDRTVASIERAGRSRAFGPLQVTDEQGNPVIVEADTASASARLAELDPNELAPQGFFSLFRNMHIRRLMQMVGDVPVHIISTTDMAKMGASGAAGIYRSYSDRARLAGMKPAVFITEEAANSLGGMSYGHVLLHELTHAATAMAYRENIRGTKRIIGRLRKEVTGKLHLKGLSDAQLRDLGVAYGLFQENDATADLEFIAEAFSNQQFQHMLASFNMSPLLARELRAISGGRMQSWWQAFTAAVSNAIGMVRGQRGQTYMEAITALHPHIMQSTAWQEAKARENVYLKGPAASEVSTSLPRAVPRGPADTLMFTAEFNQRVENIKDAALSGTATNWVKRTAKALSTTGGLQRRAAELLGGYDNPFHRVADILLKRDPLAQKYRAIGERVELALRKLKHGNAAMYERLSRLLHEASRLGIDPMVPLSHVNNKHVPKTGARGARRRAGHAKMAQEWAELPADVRQIARDAAEHYRSMHKRETTAHITHAIRQALRKRHAILPAGKSEADAVEWVRSGAAARKAEEQTPEDKAFHAALGQTAQTLADIPELRRLKGLYFPLARRGKWFITATEKLATPAGAVADPSSPDGNRFLFFDKKKLTEFVEGTDYIVNVTSRWLDPLTFQRTLKTDDKVDPKTGQLVHPIEQFVVTVQNKHLMMHDSKRALLRQQQEMQDAGLDVSFSNIGQTQQELDKGSASSLAPSHVQTILRNLHQTTVGATTIGQRAVETAILDSAVRSMSTSSVLMRRLKRKGTMGYDLDLAEAMREYNTSTGHHLANLELAHDLADAETALKKFMDDRRRTTGDDTFEELQAMQRELALRFETMGSFSERGGLNRFANAVLNTAYLRHLFSPHYTIIQTLQPFMTTMPVLSAQYGDGAAWREIVRAYHMGGVRRMLGAGLRETGRAIKNINPLTESAVSDLELRARANGRGIPDQLWYDAAANEPDAAELHRLYDGVVERGFGASSGLEAAAIAESGQNFAEKVLRKTSNVAKGLPEAAEGINRYTTATAAYRLARRAGLSEADARTKAILTVEQTQGGYARANNPRFFQHQLARLPAQFHKYGVMYAQLYYGTLAAALRFRSDPQTAKIARKQLARLSATTFMFAGVGGLPFIELARIFANVAVAIGLSDDDWEDWENGMQQWFSDFIKFASGSEEIGNRLSEAAMHGLTRLGGVDTSNSLGADNLMTFGQPKTMDEEGTKAWLFDALVLGAGGAIGVDSIEALSEGDLAGIIPMPKIIDNLYKAYGLYTEGTVSKKTGEEYAPPVNIGEAIVQGLGFQPASKARQWETTGSGRAQKEENQEWNRRGALFDKWNKARLRGGAGEASRVFREDIRAWNKAHKDPKLKIDQGDLMRSRAQHERDKRERERAAK